MISLDLNILENAAGQLTNFDFDSMVVFDNKLVLAGADGIMERDNSGTDNGSAISAWGKTGNTNFGTVRQKRIRKAYVAYEAYGDGLTLGTIFDEVLAYTENLSPTNEVEESAKINGRRSGRGSVISFKFSNVNGADFSITSFSITPIILTAKPKAQSS